MKLPSDDFAFGIMVGICLAIFVALLLGTEPLKAYFDVQTVTAVFTALAAASAALGALIAAKQVRSSRSLADETSRRSLLDKLLRVHVVAQRKSERAGRLSRHYGWRVGDHQEGEVRDSFIKFVSELQQDCFGYQSCATNLGLMIRRCRNAPEATKIADVHSALLSGIASIEGIDGMHENRRMNQILVGRLPDEELRPELDPLLLPIPAI